MRLVLHEDPISGNCYKIKLVAALLGVRLALHSYSVLKGETRVPEFLNFINPNGRIPVLQVGDRFLPESSAACLYLADGSRLIPEDRFDRADMLRWMFFEQYNHEPNVATLRFWYAFVGEDSLSEVQKAMIPGKKIVGDAALKLMDDHLSTRNWFVGESITLADIALYAYTHVAEEGGAFDLSFYPAIGDWMKRIAAEPGYVPMQAGDGK